MADTVQYRMERMVPVLNDLEQKGLFTKREIAEIVKARRKFEYRLKRPSPLKQDFLDYIDYEKQLERLRLLRKKAVLRNPIENNNDNDNNNDDDAKVMKKKKKRNSLSDFAAVSHIIELYRMVTTRFKGDLQLWFQYMEFCKQRKNGRMKKVLAQVMRFHPKVPAVWIYAAAWEFDHNLNVEAARAIMQSGLRACPCSEDLWVEYLRMELTYLHKLKMRKVLLGEENGTLVRDEKQSQEENEDEFMSLEEKKEEIDGSDLFKERGFTILHTVYKSAIDALPSNFSLRIKFLKIVEATDLAHSEEMRNEIVADMRRDFSHEPQYWDWLAQLKLNDPQTTPNISSESGRREVDEVIKVYEEAIQILPSIEMFKRYIKFVMHVIIIPKEGTQNFMISDSLHAKEYISQLVTVFGKAESMGCLDDDLACQYVKLHLGMGNFDEGMKIAANFCEGKFCSSTKLWVLRVTERMKWVQKSTNPSKDDLSSVFGLLKEMVKKVAVSNVENLWVLAMELFMDDRKYFNKLLDLSYISLAKDGGSDDGFSLPVNFIRFIYKKNGIEKARDLYKRFISLPHPGLAVYKHCVELEISTGDEDGLANARKLFESALTTYSQDIDLWKRFYSMETKMGTSETANAVYWRAKKTLGDASAITT